MTDLKLIRKRADAWQELADSKTQSVYTQTIRLTTALLTAKKDVLTLSDAVEHYKQLALDTARAAIVKNVALTAQLEEAQKQLQHMIDLQPSKGTLEIEASVARINLLLMEEKLEAAEAVCDVAWWSMSNCPRLGEPDRNYNPTKKQKRDLWVALKAWRTISKKA